VTTVIQLLSALRDKDVSLWVEDDQLMFDAPVDALTPADIEQIRAHKPAILELLKVASPEAMARTVEIVDRSRPVPSALAQTRMWPIARAAGAGAAYNVQLVLALRGELDPAALQAALDTLIARHESLRTVFSADGAEQRFAAPTQVPLPVVDLAGLAAADRDRAALTHAHHDARTPIDLRTGPLVRASLVRLGAAEHLLFVTAHHIVTDCRSMEVVQKELATLYAAYHRGQPDPLPALPFQYADYAAWQRRSQAVPLLRDQLTYWTRQLAGAPRALTLPTDRPRPPTRSFRGASLDLALAPELVAGLRALARSQDVTLSMTLSAAWAALLSRLSGQLDVLIGVPVANRQRPELQDLVGLLVNTVVLRTALTADTTVAELLAQMKDATLAAHARPELGFEQIVEALSVAEPGHNPVFQALFSFVLPASPQEPLRLPGVTLVHKAALTTAPAGRDAFVIQETEAYVEAALAAARREGGHLFGCGVGGTVDVSLLLREAGDRIVGGLNYAADLFDRATIERWAGGLRAMLATMVRDPHAAIRTLPLSDPA
jgi:hypothetical protein